MGPGLIDVLLDRTIVLSFDRLGFRRHRRFFDASDLQVDLSGRVCLVTGGNAGLGRAAASAFARLGAEVWLLCRSEARGEAAAAAIRAETGATAVHVATVDLADLGSVRAAVAAFPRRSVDVLVNNAGILPDTYQRTRDGLEVTLATNLVGPFLLTMLLLPRLGRCQDARVVTVSSGGMYSQRLDVGALNADPSQPFDGVAAYARTKRAEVVLNELWADRLRHLPITFSAMHPGWADTPGVRSSLPRFWAATRLILRSAAEGADTIVWLAAARKLEGQTGQFWFDRARVDTYLLASTRPPPGEPERLWEALVRWSGLTATELSSLEQRRSTLS